ncbi:MAG: ATP-grasp domain-containing protein [Bacillota bacterium]|nr:ATP-grasp domain-containing protein [Bacillota bacterium]
MKILFTSIGRRVELVQAFKKAAMELNIPLKIIGADILDSAPALYFCDEKELVPRIKDDLYIPRLLSICKNKSISCLIPTIDTDLLLLAKHKERFEEIGTKVLISDVDKVSLCRNKVVTADYFISQGLNSPKAYNSVEKYIDDMGEGAFPAFIKPKDGSSSVNAYKVSDVDNLKFYSEKIDSYVIQKFIDGIEFTIDIFCDYYGHPVFVTPRERLAVRSGEVLKTKINQDDTIISEMLNLIKDFKPCGQITVQCIKDKITNKNYYIEINPRFGGGAPLSIKAGADSAKATLQMLNGEQLFYCEKAAKDGAIYSRYDQSICINEDNN